MSSFKSGLGCGITPGPDAPGGSGAVLERCSPAWRSQEEAASVISGTLRARDLPLILFLQFRQQ